MYNGEDCYWNPDNEFIDFVLKHTIYFPGLVKGNGALIDIENIATCAHVVIQQEENQD